MALQGFDFPLTYSSFESIGSRVWRKLQLTQEEIDYFYVGPSVLPWQRMGNFIHHDGTITEEYNSNQITLQHNTLKVLKELGMTSIYPTFAGFIPRGILRLYPHIKHYNLSWNDFPESSQTTLITRRRFIFKNRWNVH